MERLDLQYLTPKSARLYEYLVIPKLMIEHEAFDGLDYGTKILYSLILNRASLSAKNADRFTDDEGRLYIIYPGEGIERDMRCSPPTARKMMKQLETIGLIERIRHGQGKPSTIYVKDFSSVSLLKANTLPSRKQSDCVQEGKNFTFKNDKTLPSLLKEYNKHDNRKPNTINPSEDERTVDGLMDGMDDHNKITIEQLRDDVGYEVLTEGFDHGLIDSIIGIMADCINSTAPKVRVGGEEVAGMAVRDRFKGLEHGHIEYAAECLKKAGRIKNLKAYIMTTLYNAPTTMDAYYENAVRNDMKEGKI